MHGHLVCPVQVNMVGRGGCVNTYDGGGGSLGQDVWYSRVLRNNASACTWEPPTNVLRGGLSRVNPRP